MPRSGTRRELRTVLFTDIVESTRQIASFGDQRWTQILDQHDALAREKLAECDGVEVGKTLGDGFLATFDVPRNAVSCARGIADAVRALKLNVRAGIHTGECEVSGSNVDGIAVHIAARIAEAATPGEILVSNTVKDLVTGAGLSFTERGTHALRGVPGDWALFALKKTKRATPKPTPASAKKRPQTTQKRALSVLLVDDHPLWRRTLRQVLEVENAAHVAGEALDGAEAVDLAQSIDPDVVIMDMDLPQLNGVEASRQILSANPAAKILFLSAADTREKVLDAVDAGACGYLLKTAEPEEIVDAVRRIADGEAVFTPSLAGVVLDEFRRLSSAGRSVRNPLDTLTAREREVLALMAEGRSNQAIGQHLHLSTKTIEGHVASIFQKLALEEAPDDHRRVLAVVAYLRSA